MFDQLSAQFLLLKCTGNHIWSLETCRREGIPEAWIEELKDGSESGFDIDQNTIYVEGEFGGEKMVNQYEGVLDLHLAYKLAEYIGIDWQRETATALGRAAEVKALQDALDEI